MWVDATAEPAAVLSELQPAVGAEQEAAQAAEESGVAAARV